MSTHPVQHRLATLWLLVVYAALLAACQPPAAATPTAASPTLPPPTVAVTAIPSPTVPTATPAPTATATLPPVVLYLPPPFAPQSTAAQALHRHLQTAIAGISLQIANSDAELAQAACQPHVLALLNAAAQQLLAEDTTCTPTVLFALQSTTAEPLAVVVPASSAAQSLRDLDGQRWAVVALTDTQHTMQAHQWLLAQGVLPAQWEDFPTAADALAAIAASKAEFTVLPEATAAQLSAWRVLATLPAPTPAVFALAPDVDADTQRTIVSSLQAIAQPAQCAEICDGDGYDWQALTRR